MEPAARFPQPRDPAQIAAAAADPELSAARRTFMAKAFAYGYHRNFSWLGIPIIQLPQDIVAVQEIVWATRPTLVIETGVAFGGSLVLYATLFELIGGPGEALGVEVEMRPENEAALFAHPFARRIRLLKGSSTDPSIVAEVRRRAAGEPRVMVVLDSDHSHEHVRRELELYADLVSVGCYLIVFGTSVAELPESDAYRRPWNSRRNPKSALEEWLPLDGRFRIDRNLSDRLVISDAPAGYLRRER